MKIGVISDTHIPERADNIPQEILAEFKNVDMIVHAGDFVEMGVLDKLKAVCPNVKAVWGNMDPAQIKQLLPEKEVFKAGKYKIGLMHGYGAPHNLIEVMLSSFKNDSVDLIIFGHSHSALNQTKNGIIFFNPGSPTDKTFSSGGSYGIIEINDKITPRIVKL